MSSRPLNDHLSHLLSQAHRHFMRQLNADGVSLDQWRVMKSLSERRGMAMRAIADDLSLNPPTLTKIVDRLVQDGFVYRAPDSSDRRKIYVFLSDSGAELLTTLSTHVDKCEAQAEHIFGNEDADKLKSMLEDFVRQMGNR